MTTTLADARLLGDRLEHWAQTRPDATAMTYAGDSWTWSQWSDRIGRTAGALRASGIGAGDRIAYFDRNHPACVELTLAAASLGAATAVVNFRLAADEIAYILADCGAKLVVVGAELVPVLEAVRADLPAVERVVIIGGANDQYEAWLASAPSVEPDPAVRPDDTCLLLYTSGTTGFPKGAMLTHRGLCAHSAAVAAGWRLDENSVNLVAMPLFHVGGSSYVQVGISQGVPTIMTREADGPSLMAALAGGASHAFLVPAVVAGILQAGEPAVSAFSSLAVLGYGASPMPLPVLRAAAAAWPATDLLQVYGMTEACGVVTTLDADAHRDAAHPERLASAGTPIDGVELRVVDPVTGQDCAVGETGEVWVRTGQVMAGYWNKPEATAAALTPDGWLRSGDLGMLDEDGFLFIVDRLKDMIITGGENVYSPEVERVIAEFPGLAEVAVIGIPDDRWGEAIMAYVAPVPGVVLDPDAVIAFTRERLAHFKCPTRVEVIDLLPRNGTGKILKRDLRAPFWTGHTRNVN